MKVLQYSMSSTQKTHREVIPVLHVLHRGQCEPGRNGSWGQPGLVACDTYMLLSCACVLAWKPQHSQAGWKPQHSQGGCQCNAVPLHYCNVAELAHDDGMASVCHEGLPGDVHLASKTACDERWLNRTGELKKPKIAGPQDGEECHCWTYCSGTLLGSGTPIQQGCYITQDTQPGQSHATDGEPCC